MPDGPRKADGYARIIGTTFTCLRKTPIVGRGAAWKVQMLSPGLKERAK